MANVIINPQSGILEFNTGTAGSSVFDNSFSGAARLTFNTGEVNLKSYATGVLDRFTVDGSQGRLFSVSDSLTGSIFSVNDIAGLPIIEVNSTTTDIVNIGTYGTNALVVSGSGIGMGVAAPTAKLDIRDTWNNAATTFTAVKADVTDTSSNAASTLMDLRVGGVSKFSVDKTGTLTIPAFPSKIVFSGAWSMNGYSSGLTMASASGSDYFRFTSNLFRLNSGIQIGWVAGNDPNTTADLILSRDAANTLAQRNGANAQIFRLYNTYTDASNYERGFFRWNSNVLQIGTEKLGTGTARALEFQTDGTTRMTIQTAGTLLITGGIGTSNGSGGGRFGYYDGTNWSSYFVFTNANVIYSNSTATVGIGTTSPSSKLTITGGDVEVTDSARGVILKSPDGTRYRITVANGGTLTVTAV